MARLFLVAALLVSALGCGRDRDAPRTAQPCATLTPLPPPTPTPVVAPIAAPAPPAVPVVVAEAEPAPHARHHHRHRSQGMTQTQSLLRALTQSQFLTSQHVMTNLSPPSQPPIGPLVRPLPPIGAPAAQAVAAVIITHIAEFRRCYEMGVHLDPRLAGRVVLHLTVETDGRPSGVTVAHGVGFDNVAACMTVLIRRWQFGPVGAPTPVDIPIVLTPPP